MRRRETADVVRSRGGSRRRESALVRGRLSGRRASVLAALACLQLACGGSADTSGSDSTTAADVDKLRALPYLGFSKEKADPGLMGVVHHEPDRAYEGYNVVTTRSLCRTDVLDMAGNRVHTWKDPATCFNWSNAEILPDGDLIVEQMDRRRSDEFEEWLRSSHLLRLSWSGDVAFKTRLTAHHDAELTPRGQILTLHVDWRLIPEVHPSVEVRDHGLTLLDGEGRVLEQASLYDLLSTDSEVFQFSKVAETKNDFGKEDIDLIHANSVEWMHRPELAERDPIYAPSNVLVSLRHQDSLVIIDWDEQRVVWSWGRGELSGQHDATVLANGNILCFDNGLDRGWSRVVEIDPLSREIVWEYHAPDPEDFFSYSRGAAQRLPNGNTLITNSDSGHAFEVTREGQVVWEWYTPMLDRKGRRATVVRMKRYESAFLAPRLAADEAVGGRS